MRRGQALVVQAVLDLRRVPDHRAEMTSQLLLGEAVRVLEAGRPEGWARVENRADGYRGWVRSWGLIPVTAAEARQWLLRAVPVRAVRADARSGPGWGPLVAPLVWNSRVIPGSRRGRQRAVRLPGGLTAWVPATALGRRPPPRLGDRVAGLLGIPYLWGGRSPMGFDCSGLSQQLLAERGFALPRDTTQQIRRCRPLRAGERPRALDLVFFRGRRGEVGHVGVGLGGGRFVHARGVVKINSLDAVSPLYDKELNGTEVGWFRLLAAAHGVPGKAVERGGAARPPLDRARPRS